MTTPFDREANHAHPVVAGIRDDSDGLQDRTAELSAWLDFLRYPDDQSPPLGPAHVTPKTIIFEEQEEGFEVNSRLLEYGPANWVTRSVLRNFDEPDDLLEAARVLDQCTEAALEPAFEKYLTGYLCAPENGLGQPYPGASDLGGEHGGSYPTKDEFRNGLLEMRKSWLEEGSFAAEDWENNWIRFAVGNEKCFFALAGALVRYRACYLSARLELAEATKGITERFAEKWQTPDGSSGGGPSWTSALIAGVGALAITAATAGTGAPAASGLFASFCIGTTAALAQEATSSGGTRTVTDHGLWSELVSDFHDEITALMSDLARSLDRTRTQMVTEFEHIRSEHGFVPPEPDRSIRKVPSSGRHLDPELLTIGIDRNLTGPLADSLEPNTAKYAEARSLTGTGPGWHARSSHLHGEVVTASETFLTELADLATNAINSHATMVKDLRTYGEDLKHVAATARESDDHVTDVLNRLLAEVENA